MNGVRSHSHVSTHASIYLDVVSSDVQNFTYDESITRQHSAAKNPFANDSFAFSC